MSRVKQKCTVVSKKVSLEDVKEMLEKQENIQKPNTRSGEEDAFSKTLKGSKVYLKEHGLLDETTED